eukprot:COSAG06_NODE_57345_length_280_cov_1.425414_1_plen_43_part_10
MRGGANGGVACGRRLVTRWSTASLHGPAVQPVLHHPEVDWRDD